MNEDDELISLVQPGAPSEPEIEEQSIIPVLEGASEPEVEPEALGPGAPSELEIEEQSTIPIDLKYESEGTSEPEVESEALGLSVVNPVEPEITEVFEKKELPSSDLIEKTEDEDLGIKQLVSKFSSTVETIIQNHKKDRSQLNDAITYFEEEVKEARKSNKRLSSSMIDGWAKLLQTKTEINANASRVLDSVTRLISAGKGNDLIINLNQKAATDIDLDTLLNQPKYEDEEDGK